jgi:hypothetical protein
MNTINSYRGGLSNRFSCLQPFNRYFRFVDICIVVFLLYSCDSVETNEPGVWMPTGLDGVEVHELKEANGYLYAAAGKKGLYRKRIRPAGQWEQLGQVADSALRVVTSLFDNDNDILYAGIFEPGYHMPGIYKSVDEGKSWEPFDEGISDVMEEPNIFPARIISITKPFPDSENIFVAHSSKGLFKRGHNTDQWDYMGGPPVGGEFQAFVFNPADPDQILYGGNDGFSLVRLFKTDDLGKTWDQLDKFYELYPRGFDFIYSISVDPENQTVYWCLDRYLIKSNIVGESFEIINNIKNDEGEMISIGCSNIEINPSKPNEMMISGYTSHGSPDYLKELGIYPYRPMLYSGDYGQTWQVISDHERENIRDFYVDWDSRWVYASVLHPEPGVFKFRF